MSDADKAMALAFAQAAQQNLPSPRKLKAKWTIEAQQDLVNFHMTDEAAAELRRQLSNALLGIML